MAEKNAEKGICLWSLLNAKAMGEDDGDVVCL